MFSTFFLSIVLGQAAPAKALELPPKVEAKRDRMVSIKPNTTAKRITWEIPGRVDFQPKPAAFVAGEAMVKVEMDAGITLLLAAPPGEYRIRAFAAVTDSVAFAETVLVVTGDVPRPPDPTPPDPPSPPADTFKSDLATLLGADKVATKAQAQSLSSLYHLAATEAKKPEYTTFEALLTVITDAISIKFGAEPLKTVRERVKRELVAALPDPSGDLTPAARDKAADIYDRASAALADASK